jgi:ribosomal protein S15P/S13E
MWRRNCFLRQKMEKIGAEVNPAKGLMTNLYKLKSISPKQTTTHTDRDGDVLIGKGKRVKKTSEALMHEMEAMENPVVWIWYPWRATPEPPTPSLPAPNALKNLHGALYSNLSPIQQKRQAAMMYGMTIAESRNANFANRHPFLSKVLNELDGKPKGFPFWYKKYPTRRHAFENRFNIPTEMLDGYPAPVRQALSKENMSVAEKQKAEKALYIEKYAEHDLDVSSPAVQCVMVALKVREYRNHLLTHPNNNIFKGFLGMAERSLNRSLRRLRKIDFLKYWEILRDHDVQDIVQPPNLVRYRWGNYWFYEWDAGLSMSTNIPDFMDPRGMNGCVETGRSRAEVARDLGLSYTRALMDNEKKQLADHKKYFEHLIRMKTEEPEALKKRQTRVFRSKFTGMFHKATKMNTLVDFPSKKRNLLRVRVLRWKSKRHGPQ